MPILLDNLDEASSALLVNTPKPSFFSKSLTGNGRNKVGLLNVNRLPERNAAQVPKNQPPIRVMDFKYTQSSSSADYESIPMMILDISSRVKTKTLFDNAVCISDMTSTEKVYVMVAMHDEILVITDKNSYSGVTKKELFNMYDIYFIVEDNSLPNGEYYMTVFTEPCLNTQQFANTSNLSGWMRTVAGRMDTQLLDDYFGGLTVYDAVINSVELWQKYLPEFAKIAIDNSLDSQLTTMCIRLNNYSVNLVDYKEIYDYISTNRQDLIEEVTNVNLNLLLNDTLKTLEANKPNIQTFTPQATIAGTVTLSNEQLKAVCTTEPCCIVQAGAGTGKSTVINNRLKYLEQCGVDLSNVMVLSFTNAAADHIKSIAPEVNSKTIASMIHDIYAMNWDHNLSTVDTMLNIIQATKTIANTQIGMNLINALRYLKKDINTGLINLSTLVQKHFDEVIDVLNKINQTTLELESIICYHAKNLQEPNNLCTHLIMDEVQDNSIFEFIYIINYVVRHNACLYLVGDCSQTLYEFRASNPKALNCLEMSGVFECMALQTNYRSNQNILDFANLTLNTIEANQYAKIQLHANNFARRAFDEDVNVEYYQLKNKTTDLDAAFGGMIVDIKDWIDKKIQAGEQVAFLSYKRNDLTRFEDVVEKLFPQYSLINIVPTKCYPNCFLSKYIFYFGDDFIHKSGNDVTIEVMRHIIDNIDRLCKNDQQKITLKTIVNEWMASKKNEFLAKDILVSNGQMSYDDFITEVFNSLVEFEIDKNAMKQRLVSSANEKMKEEDYSGYNFVVSTIHSAKGLEFDNVILLYDESKKNEEEDKRMYYVGLTRAKNSEQVLAYNTSVGSDIKGSYEAMVTALAPKTSNANDDSDDDADDDDTATGADTPATDADDSAEKSDDNNCSDGGDDND